MDIGSHALMLSLAHADASVNFHDHCCISKSFTDCTEHKATERYR